MPPPWWDEHMKHPLAAARRALVYELVGHDVVPVDQDDSEGILRAFSVEPERRGVGYTKVGTMAVSTVFLIVDYNFNPWATHPLLFETATFSDHGINIVQRYATWEEAEAGHAQVVLELRGLT